MADFGYDVANYTDVDPLFGTLATLDELIAQAHRRDLRILVDLVLNHSSSQHPWFIGSRSSRDHSWRDWYTWADPAPDGGPPNNWVSVFGGPAWEWHAPTGQYYLHMFLEQQPDLNWRNPAVEQAMFDVTRFWLERGVDGFRLDVPLFIMKDPLLRDNPPAPPGHMTAHRPMGDWDTQYHVHDHGHPDIHGVFRRFRKVLDDHSDERPRMAVGETHIFDWRKWARYYGEDLDEMHMPFNFALLNVPWEAQAVQGVVDGLEANLPPGAWPNYVLGNHDEPRIASRYGPGGARLAAMLLLTLRGTPTLYYGDEIGMTDVDVPPARMQDPLGIRDPERGRDPERTPMQWSAAPNAGFSPPDTSHLWLPLGDDYRTTNVAQQRDDPTSTLTLYRRLLAYRSATPALQRGSYRPVENACPDCYTYLRTWEDEQRLVALNFSDRPQSIRLPLTGSGRVVLSTHLDREEPVEPSEFELRPHEGVVVDLHSTE
jgi:alpha-glucosidase